MIKEFTTYSHRMDLTDEQKTTYAIESVAEAGLYIARGDILTINASGFLGKYLLYKVIQKAATRFGMEGALDAELTAFAKNLLVYLDDKTK